MSDLLQFYGIFAAGLLLGFLLYRDPHKMSLKAAVLTAVFWLPALVFITLVVVAARLIVRKSHG